MRDICKEMILTIKSYDPINIEEDLEYLYEMTNENDQQTTEKEINDEIILHRPDLGEEVKHALKPGYLADLRVPHGIDKA